MRLDFTLLTSCRRCWKMRTRWLTWQTFRSGHFFLSCNCGIYVRQPFQVASCTLDASAKIYAGRVDSVHAEAFKILGGLGSGRQRDGDEEANGQGEQDAATKRTRKVRLIDSLTNQCSSDYWYWLVTECLGGWLIDAPSCWLTGNCVCWFSLSAIGRSCHLVQSSRMWKIWMSTTSIWSLK